MNSKLPLSLLFLLAALGCDHSSAGTSGIEDGINHSLANQPVCLDEKLSSFPTQPISPKPEYEALAAAGLLRKDVAADGVDVVYTLTEEGRKTQFKPLDGEPVKDPNLFCGGVLKVDKIINFTEPADGNGVRETQVVYTAKLASVPKWVSNPAIQISLPNWTPVVLGNPTRAKALSAQRKTAKLQLTHKGWRDSGDM
jgi:hypothetical protein